MTVKQKFESKKKKKQKNHNPYATHIIFIIYHAPYFDSS